MKFCLFFKLKFTVQDKGSNQKIKEQSLSSIHLLSQILEFVIVFLQVLSRFNYTMAKQWK
jgi:hypothetical protein